MTAAHSVDPEGDAASRPPRVLHIEDDELERRALLRTLRDRGLGWEVMQARTLGEARTLLAAGPLDVIIADNHLPDGESTELLGEIGDVPFVLVTGTLEEQLALRTLERGADDYLVKDVERRHLDALPTIVEKTLLRRTIREREQQLARQLRESERRLRAIFDNAASGILQTDHEDRFVAVNDRVCQMLGYRQDELLAMTVHDLTYPEDRPRSDALNADLHEGRLPMLQYEKRYVKRDGSPLWVLVAVSAVRDEAGRHLYSVGTVVDISARKAAEAEVRLHSAALEAAPNAISLSKTDDEGTIVWVNRAFTRLTGYTPEEAIGRSHHVLSSGEQSLDFYRELWETILRGDVWRGELVNRRKDGSLYHEEMGITPVRDEAGRTTHYVAIKQDITARKQAETELAGAKQAAERARAAAEEASRAKDHFLAVLSHELRTPLTPVLASLSMLEDADGLSQIVRDRLDMMRRNIELEARLIDDLLDVTRIARGRVELDRRPTRLADVIRRAVEVVQPDIDARKLHFGVDMSDDSYVVDVDAARLQQVLWNLLRNAVKFTPRAGCVGIECRRGGDGYVVIAVHDSGEGIAPERLPTIFSAFEAARPGRRQFGGLGLGLTISKALVEMHGGSIVAHSEGKGRGATFSVRLPLAEAEPHPELRRAAGPAPRALRILFVEDHGDTAEMMGLLLATNGHEVEHVSDVASALEHAGRPGFDLLISDLGLPDGSGLDLMREIRRRGLRLPGIALSGYGQEEDVRGSLEAGFVAHITKPASPEKLAEIIARVVGGAGGGRA